MKNILFIAFLLISLNLYSVNIFQDNVYKISNIAGSLKENSHAVIRYEEEKYNIKSKSNFTKRVKKVISILKMSGKKFADISVYYGIFDKVMYIRGKIYDKEGKQVRRIKKDDIKDYSYSSSGTLFSDSRVKYIEEPTIKPPYTIEYEYGILGIGMFSFPVWTPVTAFNVATEKSRLSIFTKNELSINTKELNFDGTKDKYTLENGVEYIWKVKNLKSIEREPFNSDYYNYIPVVKIAPSKFKIDGYYGKTDSWNDIGKWSSQLLNGRDVLTIETQNKIKELVKGVENEVDKAKIIYEYMQSKTRYVSIQVGIGGWQPFPAETVDRVGYGDCKALSNYMKALLKLVGIKSHYVLIRAGSNYSELDKSFPANQFNHAILCIPSKEDTIWLECTSQKSPFGYLGDFTDDRDALLIKENGGELAHTTVYRAEINRQDIKIEADLKEEGEIKAKVKTVYSGLQYDNISGILTLDDEKKEKKLQEIISIPNLEILKFSYEDNKERIPSIIENLELRIPKYASISSKRLFLPINILNKVDYVPRKIENRKTEIIIRRGYTDIDTIIYNLPQGYKVEYIPDNINTKTKFGEFSINLQYKNGKLLYVRKRIINKGTFPASDYEELRNYYKIMYKADKENAVFVKND